MSQDSSSHPPSYFPPSSIHRPAVTGNTPMTPALARGSNLPRVACFAVQAEADPGILPRVLALFAKRSLVPDRCTGQRSLRDENELLIDLQVAGLDREQTDYIARCLGQIPGVLSVLTAEKAAEL
jgi:hypothetical protein